MQCLVAGPAPVDTCTRAQLRTDQPIPTPGPGEVVVQVAYASHNPPDAYPFIPQSLALQYCKPDSHLGCDFSGIVTAVGTPGRCAMPPVGAKVYGWVPGNMGQWGAFAEYIVADAALVFKVPEDVAMNEAAALSFSFSTAVHALGSCMHLDIEPSSHTAQEPVLVWGGGTACGFYATQILKIAGYTVISVGGQAKAGADTILSRHDVPAAIRTIRQQWPQLRFAIDCFGSQETGEACQRALGEAGGLVHTLLPVKVLPELEGKVTTQFELVHAMFGRPLDVFKLLDTYPSDEILVRDYSLALRWGAYDQGWLYRLLSEHKLQLLPVTMWPPSDAPQDRGLVGVQNALESFTAHTIGVKAGVVPFPTGKVVHQIQTLS